VEVQVAELENVGFVPVVPVGGPPEAITVQQDGATSAAEREEQDDLQQGSSPWLRDDTYRAWQVSEQTVIRTKEGRAAAQPGDWVIEALSRFQPAYASRNWST
jgi:hypothetical protein